MVLDLQFFGYGVGLVMTGWVCGQIVAVILTALSNKGMR